MKSKALSYFIIGTFVSLYLIVSIISTIHVIDFFKLSNPVWLAISLAVAFEIGAAASLASLIALKKMNRSLVWGLFITLTCMQMMGNTYYAFTHLQNYQGWIDLFGLTDEDPLYQKRVLSIISGAVLPLVALGFIKSLVDYIKPSDVEIETPVKKVAPTSNEPKFTMPTEEESSNWDVTLNDGLEEIEETQISEIPDGSLTDEQLDALAATGELTKRDIENYKEKTRIPERGKNKGENFRNPQIMPGVN